MPNEQSKCYTNVCMADGAATSEAVIFSAPYCPINEPSSLNRLGSGSAYSSRLSLSLSRGPLS